MHGSSWDPAAILEQSGPNVYAGKRFPRSWRWHGIEIGSSRKSLDDVTYSASRGGKFRASTTLLLSAEIKNDIGPHLSKALGGCVLGPASGRGEIMRRRS